ncbi:MAG: hydrogenase maturation protease [Thermoanaerobaculum sp.]|nr:hydrogenase maturation protease [Thermoanaerobaculum sp.]MDW7968491.1 hydrogenase maturation protease [Thermoanaerobaculum sp.]
MSRVLVVAFGNPFMGDDGAGPAVLQHLARLGVPAGVRLADGGTDATNLAHLWQGEDTVILVDAMTRGAAAGTIHQLTLDQLLRVPQPHEGVHALSLPACVHWVLLAYPELAQTNFWVFGVEPQRVASNTGLSPKVAQAVEELAQRLHGLLGDRCHSRSKT